MEENLNNAPNENEQNNAPVDAKVKKPKMYLILKIVAIILLLGSLTMIILSFTLGDEMDSNFGLRMGGFLCLPICIFLMFIAFLPNIQRAMIKTNKYVIDKNKEDLKDISQQSGEISALGAKEVAKSVSKGVMEEVQPDNNLADKNEKQIFCKHCGQKIDADSKFCSHCGKEQ
mgnify:FL=1